MATTRKIKRTELSSVKHELMLKQNGACMFCGGDLTRVASNNVVVDHNHKTGVIRGVAHRGCNGLEGKVLKVFQTWGKCSSKAEILRTMKRLTLFWAKEPTTEYIYPTHKTPAERKALLNKRRRLAYKKKKEAQNG